MKLSYVVAAIALCLSPAPVALAQGNLILNGNFGTGDFTDWTVTDPSGSVVTSNLNGIAARSPDTYFADFPNYTYQGNAPISQAFNTVPGDLYTVAFYLEPHNAPNHGDGVQNDFNVTFGSQVLMDGSVQGPSSSDGLNLPLSDSWNLYQYTVTASGSNTILTLGGANNSGSMGLSDVSVTVSSGVPEASPFFVGLLGLGGIGILCRRRTCCLHTRMPTGER